MLASCMITKAIWKNGYEDRIHSFAVSQDGNYIGFMGLNYHYVLIDDKRLLKDLLASQVRGIMMINTEKSVIKIDHENNISGEVFIETTTLDFPSQYRAFLHGIGFKMDDEGNYYLKIKISGKRYLPRSDQDLNESKLPRLGVPYKIFIQEEMGATKKAGAIALTPITMTLDGILLIGKVVLLPWSSN